MGARVDWMAAWRLTGGLEYVLEADIERGVGVGREGHSCLAHDILRLSVLVPNSIFNLHSRERISAGAMNPRGVRNTNVHVDHLSITSLPTNSRRHHHQGVFGNKVPDTSFVFRAVPRVRLKVEFQRPRRGQNGETAQSDKEAL